MIPYYLLKSIDFDHKKIDLYSSGSQIGIDTVLDNTPSSVFTKRESAPLKGYITYDLTTETLKHQKGRAYGKSDIFQNYILIKDDLMFYNTKNSLLILSTSKDNFSKFISRFDNNSVFTFSTIPINFSVLIDNVLNLGTDGVWLGDLPSTTINAIGLMGHKIQDSAEYQQYIASGAVITNISFLYDNNGVQEKVMVSREGGIILYQSKPTVDALSLVTDIYTKMLLND